MQVENKPKTAVIPSIFLKRPYNSQNASILSVNVNQTERKLHFFRLNQEVAEITLQSWSFRSNV